MITDRDLMDIELQLQSLTHLCRRAGKLEVRPHGPARAILDSAESTIATIRRQLEDLDYRLYRDSQPKVHGGTHAAAAR